MSRTWVEQHLCANTSTWALHVESKRLWNNSLFSSLFLGRPYFCSTLLSTARFPLLQTDWLKWKIYLGIIPLTTAQAPSTTHLRQAELLSPLSEAANFPRPPAPKVNTRLTLAKQFKAPVAPVGCSGLHRCVAPGNARLTARHPPPGNVQQWGSLFPAWEHIAARAFRNSPINFCFFQALIADREKKREAEMMIT